jgi:hypothetical protein
MLRAVLAELFPNWMKSHATCKQRSASSGSLSVLASLQRKIEMADKQKPAVRNPEAPGPRSAKADPDREETTGGPKAPRTSGTPTRGVREDPAPNPNGNPKSQVSHGKPVTGA